MSNANPTFVGNYAASGGYAYGRNVRWWTEPENNAHAAIAAVWRHIRDTQRWRRDADEYHASLYAGGPGAAGILQNVRADSEYDPTTLPYNICRGGTDTLVAKIAKQRPLPQVLTQRGNWANQKRARKMSQFLEGEFYRQKIFEKFGKLIVRDAAIFGRGLLKVWREGKRLRVERAHPWEVYADDWDARYNEPRNLYQIRTIDKNVLLELYARKPDGEWDQDIFDAITRAASVSSLYRVDDEISDYGDPTVDRVQVVEAWHLRSSEDAEDGRHVVAIEGHTLFDETYEQDYFPFAVLHYSDPIAGYWGQGLVEQLEGFQYEINLMSEKMSEAHNLLGGGIVFLPIGSEITETHLTNGIGTIVRHKPGMAPQYVTPAPVHPQTYQRQRDLPQDALADVGLSQLSARSEKPAGLNAAVALQTYTDIETERFAIFARSYEAWCLDVARMFIDVARDIAKTHGDYAVNVPLRGGILDLSWKDVVVDGYELRVFPTSLLPQQPAARLEKLMTLFNAQVIDRATFLRELDAPDLSAEMDMETADKLNVDERLEAMLDAEDPGASGAYRMLTPYQDIAWGLRRAQQRLNKAETDGAPEDNLRLLRRFITDGEALQDRLKREAAANTNGTPPATGAPPPGPPGGPPPPAAPPPPGMPPANPAPPIAA